MPLLPMLAVVAALAWTAGCAWFVRGPVGALVQGRFAPDRMYFAAAVGSLALAPWISLAVYYADADRSPWGGSVNLVVAAVLFLAALRARGRAAAGAPPSATPFRQKSAALMALTLVTVYVWYFVVTWRAPALIIPMFIGSAVLVAAVATIGHLLLVLFHSPVEEADAAADERDRDAERYSVRQAYRVLALGIWVVPGVCLLRQPLLVIANTAFVFIVLAEVVKYAALLRYYRHSEP